MGDSLSPSWPTQVAGFRPVTVTQRSAPHRQRCPASWRAPPWSHRWLLHTPATAGMSPTDGIQFGAPPGLILHTYTSNPKRPPVPSWSSGYQEPPDTTGRLATHPEPRPCPSLTTVSQPVPIAQDLRVEGLDRSQGWTAWLEGMDGWLG